jgi:hypothetical protein
MDKSCLSLVSTLARKVMQREALREALSEIPSGIVEVMKSEELKSAVKKFWDCTVTISKAVASAGCEYVIGILSGKKPEAASSAQ